jgi:hypothetical protein
VTVHSYHTVQYTRAAGHDGQNAQPRGHWASQEQLIVELGEKVIRPAELKALDLQSSTPPPSTISVMTEIMDSTPPAALAG